MKKTILLSLIILPLITIGQNSESYFPIEIGKEKTLTWYKGQYVESFIDSTMLGGKKYYKYLQNFKQGGIEMPIRISNDTVYYWNDAKKIHRAFFGINPKIGETIGDGTILEVDAKLRTPKGKLKDLLVIEMNYPNGASDIRYYQKGMGLVAVKNKKKLVCYYLPK